MLLLKKFFLAITLLTISASASAVTEHDTSLLLGSDSPDNLTFSYIFAADTTIDDIYLFKIVTGTPSSSLAASATSLELNNSFNIIAQMKYHQKDKRNAEPSMNASDHFAVRKHIRNDTCDDHAH